MRADPRFTKNACPGLGHGPCGRTKFRHRTACYYCTLDLKLGRARSGEGPVLGCSCCGSLPRRVATCHVCQGSQRMTLEQAIEHFTDIWARPGCPCEACRFTGPGPGRDEVLGA